MKLTTAIAQFLYSTKRLDIAGVGTFILDPSVVIADTDQSKQQKNSVVEGITFESNTSIKESPGLVDYISTQTGKMKALAAADLSSHLELMQQFLNIGKPFILEGIGSLVKVKSGVYEFTPGAMLTEKLKEISSKSDDPGVSSKEQTDTYEPFLKKEKSSTAWRKPVALLLVLAGIGFAVWGGYTIYKKNEDQKKETDSPPSSTESVSATTATQDTVAIQTVQQTTTVPTAAPSGTYKFILETSLAKRALDRFNKLRNYNWPVKMETNDSVNFKIFMLLPATAADTTRIIDSLSALNGRRVMIEK